MYCLLAYADSSDPSETNLLIVLGGAAIIAFAAALASVLIFISRARRHRRSELITVAAVFWALLAAGSMLYTGQSQVNWSKEYQLRLQSGYLDPSDTNDAPSLPWATWTALGAAYGALLAWTFSPQRTYPR